MSTKKLAEFVREEQADLWHDLAQDLQSAINGAWSMGASSRAIRICNAARLVGPTPPDSVPWDLYRGGVYAAVLESGGVPFTHLPAAEVQRCDEMMEEFGKSGEKAEAMHAATVAAIRAPREWAYLQSEAGIPA